MLQGVRYNVGVGVTICRPDILKLPKEKTEGNHATRLRFVDHAKDLIVPVITLNANRYEQF